MLNNFSEEKEEKSGWFLPWLPNLEGQKMGILGGKEWTPCLSLVIPLPPLKLHPNMVYLNLAIHSLHCHPSKHTLKLISFEASGDSCSCGLRLKTYNLLFCKSFSEVDSGVCKEEDQWRQKQGVGGMMELGGFMGDDGVRVLSVLHIWFMYQYTKASSPLD